MPRFLTATIIVIMLTTPLFFVSVGTGEAASTLPPVTPHEVKVLVVSPSNLYFKGGGYLISDLAGYGFNVTQSTSDYADAVDYRNDSKTANLNQYDVVILHGSYFGRPPTNVTVEEVRHFTNYGGVLVVIGDALFVNQTRTTAPVLWDDFFFSEPLQWIETRLGIVFVDYLRNLGATYDHNNGTFTLTNNLIPGLPSSLAYVRGSYPGSQYQMIVETGVAEQVYEFTTQNGKKTAGVTFFRNATGAAGIYIQGAYIYAEQLGTNRINYLGLTETTKRSALLASLIAYALNRDINTVIKPQPLANIRLDGVGTWYGYGELYLNESLGFFNSVVDEYNITPTIGFVDYLDFKPDYWQAVVPNTLSLIKGAYRDWEYSSALRYYTDPRLMSEEQIQALIDSIEGKYSELGIDLFSTVIAPNGRWNQTTLDAMASRNLYLLDILNSAPSSDWWNLKVNSSIVVHASIPMLPERVGANLAEDFNQTGLDPDSINSKYFTQRDKIALSIVNGFVGFTYYVPNFRWNKVGPYSVQTVSQNLTSEVPDVRFVPLIEAGLYFGNKWTRVTNPTRDGAVIEFNVDASAVPNVVNIGKGMLWLRVNANESIQEVSINGDRWFYFDEHSIRLPTPESSAHIRVVLGTAPSPRVVESRYKVVRASYNGYRLNVSISSAESLNVSVRLSIPKAGVFSKDNWSVFFLEQTLWNFNFNAENRVLDFWAISNGFLSFEVGVFWIIDQTPPWYNSSVTLSANFSGLELEITDVILSYNLGEEWTNKTTTPQNGLWVSTIPAMSYGTLVRYRLFAYAAIGKWFVTEVFNYNVIDQTPPVVENFEWGPSDPAAGQPVSVKAVTSEPQNASGVKNVALRYYVGTDVTDKLRAQTINMTNQSGTWTAEIPGQGGGNIVTFSVIAVDNAGNSAETNATRYNVWILPIPMWLTLSIIGAIAVIIIVAVLYFFKFRRTKPKAEVPKVAKSSKVAKLKKP
jgi:hypothetical protein